MDEPAGVIYSGLRNRQEKHELLKDRIGFVSKQFIIGQDSIMNALNDSDIILCDRGVLDTFVWYDMYYKMGMMSRNQYMQYMDKIESCNEYFNMFYALYVDSFVSLKRDYLNSLSLEPRTTMNEENIERYNASLLSLMPKYEQEIDNVKMIDTTNRFIMEPSLMVANDVMDIVKKRCLRK